MMQRELAWRIFAGEYTDATLEHSSGEERAPGYVITPLGAKVNRLFLVGVITDVEDIGGNGGNGQSMWRVRLTDPTGTFQVYAGQYQPEAAAMLSQVKPPAFAAIMGKARTYSPEDGVIYTSVRPEMVKLVDASLRDYWILETAQEMRKRLEGLKEAEAMSPATVDGLVALGYRQGLSEGIVLALQHYGKVDLDRYQGMLRDALRYLLPGFQGDVPTPATAEAKKEPDTKEERLVLEIVETLDRDGKGASWDEIVDSAGKKGLSKEQLEEITNRLLDDGSLYEPILGKIRRI